MLTITLLTFAALFIVLGIIVLVISYYDIRDTTKLIAKYIVQEFTHSVAQ